MDEQSDTWPLLRGNDRKSRHRRIKKQRRYDWCLGKVVLAGLYLKLIPGQKGRAHCHVVSGLQINAFVILGCGLLIGTSRPSLIQEREVEQLEVSRNWTVLPLL